jgi:catechol 2,3-dioxygenase-like lactoylglutathione lyase family enzyme
MKLNHLDLQVPNVPEVAEFFERHFDFEILSNRASSAVVILSDGCGFTLVLQRLIHESETYPKGFHIGFLVDDIAIVHQKRAAMLACGLECSEIIENNRGTMFYFTSPGNFLIEINCSKPRRVSSLRE